MLINDTIDDNIKNKNKGKVNISSIDLKIAMAKMKKIEVSNQRNSSKNKIKYHVFQNMKPHAMYFPHKPKNHGAKLKLKKKKKLRNIGGQCKEAN